MCYKANVKYHNHHYMTNPRDGLFRLECSAYFLSRCGEAVIRRLIKLNVNEFCYPMVALIFHSICSAIEKMNLDPQQGNLVRVKAHLPSTIWRQGSILTWKERQWLRKRSNLVKEREQLTWSTSWISVQTQVQTITLHSYFSWTLNLTILSNRPNRIQQKYC